MNTLSLKQAAQFWISAFLIAVGTTLASTDIFAIDKTLVTNTLWLFCIPLLACIAISQTVAKIPHPSIAYLFFFAISITSYLGLTSTLTGSHAESSNIWMFGLSFYTASLAYLHQQKATTSNTALIVSNPLLIITGPIAIFIKNIQYQSRTRRFNYYLPFLIVGLFFHQGIATPITQSFYLIEKTDAASSLTFALLFEFFVYANFCGLSLIIYGLAGIMGYAIPLNFKQPFSASNIIDFWKGWHRSLSTALKALFYLPSKKKLGGTGAIFAVYLASAMWHGVTFNFLLWGLFHAAAFALTLWLLRHKVKLLPTLILIIAIVLGRLIFSDADTARLLLKLQFHFTDFSVFKELNSLPKASTISMFLISTVVMAEMLFQKHRLFRKRNYKFLRTPKMQFLILLIIIISVSITSGVDYAVYGQR